MAAIKAHQIDGNLALKQNRAEADQVQLKAVSQTNVASSMANRCEREMADTRVSLAGNQNLAGSKKRARYNHLRVVEAGVNPARLQERRIVRPDRPRSNVSVDLKGEHAANIAHISAAFRDKAAVVSNVGFSKSASQLRQLARESASANVSLLIAPALVRIFFILLFLVLMFIAFGVGISIVSTVDAISAAESVEFGMEAVSPLVQFL